MHAIQLNHALCPQAYQRTTPHVQRQDPFQSAIIASSLRLPNSRKLTNGGQKCLCLAPVCMSRDGAVSGNGDQRPLWKSFGNVFEKFGPKPSIEDVLKQQIKKGEYYDEGGDGGNPPGRGGGGGGGNSFGGSEDEGFSGIIEETIQVILATLGFIFLYIYIINGAEMTRLAKDYIKFLFGGKKSVRLTRVLDEWESFCKSLKEEKEVDRFWLEKAIINTPTWWDHPEKYRRILKAYMQMQSRSDD